VIYIAVSDAQKAYYGSEVAAPVFSKVAQYALRKLALPPVILSKTNVVEMDRGLRISGLQEKAIQRALQSESQTFPELKGLALREALRRVAPLQKDIKIQGSGFVTRTSPSPGEFWDKEKPVTLFLTE
jgi:cell division protein FtsI (penicillin-binding protein 3)